ncbi:MAG: hypothetical protein ACK5NA_09640 [Enterococcus sp.]
MTVIRQYEMKFFLNTTKALTNSSILPISYTWEITCKIRASRLDTGEIYQRIDQRINELKEAFEQNTNEFIAENVANELFKVLVKDFQKDKLILNYLRVNSSPMIGYEIMVDNWG